MCLLLFMYIIGYLTKIHVLLQNLIYSQQVLTKLSRQLYKHMCYK